MVDHGDRLDAMQQRLADATATGTTVIERYQIETVNVTLLVPFGKQDGLSLGMQSRGTATTETYDTGGHLQQRTSAPFATTFVVRREPVAAGSTLLNYRRTLSGSAPSEHAGPAPAERCVDATDARTSRAERRLALRFVLIRVSVRRQM